ncbi:response regulator [Paenibacillus alkalitolerans]|uniref:response regulator n=1 Tax=Paenibacillus alkalitolerans TaxID=2799335 RepID=UPI0018F2B463|nr:response regulator [Paenibacillus alkalitolerans]
MAIRVILADDEPLIIKGLRKLIDWEALGMDIVAQAYDGHELMEAIETHKPDIAISDISMPHRSGIDIIKEIKRRSLPVKVIFISAYQEFSYAKDAVAYGAVDYLVKPLVKRELENVLIKTVSLLRQEDEQVRQKDKLQLLERRSRNEEMRDWFVRLTDGTLSEQSEAYRTIKAEFYGPFHSIGVVDIEGIGGESERWRDQEKKLVDFAVENILTELLSGYGRGQMFYKNKRHMYAVDHADPEEAIRLAEVIREKIGSYLKLEASIGLGRPVPDIALLVQSCREAEQALSMKYFLGLNRIIVYHEHEQKRDVESELYALRSETVRGFTSNDWQAAKSAMKSMLDTIGTAAYGNQALAVSTCFSSVLFIIQEVKNSGIRLSGGGFDIHDLQSRLNRFETFAAMKQGIMGMLEELHHRIDDKAGNKEKLLMARIKQYIDDHYAEEITLDSVASIAYMNPYYFSSFFKKHTMQNFKQYVTEVRMKNAVRLLTTTDMMVYEIAEKVGYNNARHFSDMFKKMYGKLPLEFKQSAKS